MDSHETEWTVYLGTEVDPKTQLVNLLKQIQVKQVVKKEGTDSTGLYITDKDQMFHSHSSDAVNNDWFKKFDGSGGEVTNPDNNALLLEPEKHGNVTDQSIGYLITDMETGIYAVKEIPWELNPDNENDITNEIYLKDIIVDPGEGGNTNDVVEKKTSVFVVADDPNAEKVLTTTFINEYATNIFKFG